MFSDKIHDLVTPLKNDTLSELRDTNFLRIDSSIHETRINIKQNNEMLIRLLQEYNNTYTNEINTIEDRMNTTSSIYFTILIAIIVFLFNMNGKVKSAEKNDPNSSIFLIKITLLAVILLMYCLNIHLEDSKFKPIFRRQLSYKALRTLSDLKPTNSDWNKLDFNSPERNFEAHSDKICIRWTRKFLRFISPNFSQIVFYIIPLTFVLILVLIDWQKKSTFKVKKKSILL